MRVLPDNEACVNVLSGPMPLLARNAGETMVELSALSELEIDSVFFTTSMSENPRDKNFRKSKDAIDFALKIEEQIWDIGGTQRSRPKGDWDVGATLVHCEDRRFRMCSSFPNSSLRSTMEIAKKIFDYAAAHSCNYGYLGFGPDQVFVQGKSLGLTVRGSVGLTGTDDKYGGGLTRAFHEGETFRNRIVDLFLMNMVGPGHLDALVGGKRLADRIQAGGHGALHPIGNERWLWQLNEDEVNTTRHILIDSGITTAVE